MKVWKKIFIAAAALVAVGTTDVFALSGGTGVDMNLSPEQPMGYENLWNRMTRKLGRGIVNVGFGALELPIRVCEVNFNEGGLAASTFGVLSGIGYVVVREVVGVVEIVTFPFPLPNCPESVEDVGWGYGPIMRPAWVVPVGKDWNNFVYDDESIVNPAM